MTRPFRYYLRVRYQECDAQHVVFNARYGDYADLACFEFMRAALPKPTDAFDGSFEMQTVKQVVEWKGPTRFDDVLEASIWASRFGTTSFDLTVKLRRASAGEAEPSVTITTASHLALRIRSPFSRMRDLRATGIRLVEWRPTIAIAAIVSRASFGWGCISFDIRHSLFLVRYFVPR